MRTNIDIDDQLMSEAMAAGPFKTKKDAVEAGLKLLKRQAVYREVLKWGGKLPWGWDEDEERLDGESNMRRIVPPPNPTLPTATAKRAKHVGMKHGRR